MRSDVDEVHDEAVGNTGAFLTREKTQWRPRSFGHCSCCARQLLMVNLPNCLPVRSSPLGVFVPPVKYALSPKVDAVSTAGISLALSDPSSWEKERVANWWNRAYTIKCETNVRIERDQRMQGLNVKVLSRNHGSEFSFNKRNSIKVGTGHRTGSSGLSVEVSAGVNVGRGGLTSKEIPLSKKRSIGKTQQTIAVAWWFHGINYFHLMQHPQKIHTTRANDQP